MNFRVVQNFLRKRSFIESFEQIKISELCIFLKLHTFIELSIGKKVSGSFLRTNKIQILEIKVNKQSSELISVSTSLINVKKII